MIMLLFTKFMVFTLAGSLAARSPQRDSDVSDTVSSPRRCFDGVVTIFRRKVGVCDAGQAAGHRHMLRQASAWSPLFGQNVLRIVVVTVMVVMVVLGGGGGNGDGNGGDGGDGGDGDGNGGQAAYR